MAWVEEEVESLGPNMRQYMRGRLAVYETARERVKWAGPLPTSLGSRKLCELISSRLS